MNPNDKAEWTIGHIAAVVFAAVLLIPTFALQLMLWIPVLFVGAIEEIGHDIFKPKKD